MTIEEIVRGESKNVEFKAKLPKDSAKYIKTIIAFANTQGGSLVIGVDDATRKVTGVDDDSAFQIMDSIANAVADSCVPQIVPNIELQTIDGHTVILVTVAPEPNRPYYLKSKGKEHGTYIRLAGTSRPASSEKIKELELEGSHISWDELTCIGYEVTDTELEKLCRDIMQYRKESGLPVRNVTSAQLINWKLLRCTGASLLASNAYVLLVSDYFPYSKTQCAVFKGKERTVFLDKREFTGSVYEQIEEATTFVLRNIRLGAVIEGLVRKEFYELPVEAIREMIVNAHCHRNLTDASCVQVAVYDDRLEVTSPGGLYNGLTYEEIMSGHSKLRNRAIANIFNQMGLIEAWGTGNKTAERLYDYYTLLEETPPVIGEASEIHRRSIGDTSEKHRRQFRTDLNDTQIKILELLSADASLSAAKMAGQLGIAGRNVEANIKKLKEKGILIRHGSPKSGYWEIVNDKKS